MSAIISICYIHPHRVPGFSNKIRKVCTGFSLDENEHVFHAQCADVNRISKAESYDLGKPSTTFCYSTRAHHDNVSKIIVSAICS